MEERSSEKPVKGPALMFKMTGVNGLSVWANTQVWGSTRISGSVSIKSSYYDKSSKTWIEKNNVDADKALTLCELVRRAVEWIDEKAEEYRGDAALKQSAKSEAKPAEVERNGPPTSFTDDDIPF